MPHHHHTATIERHAALMDMMRNDPNGRPTKPTDTDYNAFHAWAVEKYGEQMWDMYNGSMWSPTP